MDTREVLRNLPKQADVQEPFRHDDVVVPPVEGQLTVLGMPMASSDEPEQVRGTSAGRLTRKLLPRRFR